MKKKQQQMTKMCGISELQWIKKRLVYAGIIVIACCLVVIGSILMFIII